MSKSPKFDQFLTESAQQLTEATEASTTALNEAALNEATTGKEAEMYIEECLEELGLKKGKTKKISDIGGGVNTILYKVKLSDSQFSKLEAKLQTKGIFPSHVGDSIVASFLTK